MRGVNQIENNIYYYYFLDYNKIITCINPCRINAALAIALSKRVPCIISIIVLTPSCSFPNKPLDKIYSIYI